MASKFNGFSQDEITKATTGAGIKEPGKFSLGLVIKL